MFSKRGKVAILDDFFPNLVTSFRITEYNYYLKKLKGAQVFSSYPNFDDVLIEYQNYYPNIGNKIFRLDLYRKYKASLIYTVFINNAYNYLPIIEKNKIPFVFTLYPGGGFWLNNDESDKKLKIIFNSPYFRKVIVTQKITCDYLIEKGFCNIDKIEFIYGGVFASDFYKGNYVKKKFFKKDKKTFDICFVANKYMEKGIDKGYDTFIQVAKELLLHSQEFRFHVVGNFDENDIDVYLIKDRIKFYGIKHIDFFPQFYSMMDMILSPNIPFKLSPGSFDGFPTGCCIEAGFCGVAVFCTDVLNLNFCLKNNEDISIIPKNSNVIVKIILNYFYNLDDLYTLSANCQKKFLKVFDCESQLEKRLNILQQFT